LEASGTFLYHHGILNHFLCLSISSISFASNLFLSFIFFKYLLINFVAPALTTQLTNHQISHEASCTKEPASSLHQYKSDNHQNNQACGCLSTTCHLLVIGASIFVNAPRLRFISDNHFLHTKSSTPASIIGFKILFIPSMAIIVSTSHAEDH
jgi:hypothetical protein